MLNFPKIPKIALRKFRELSNQPWRSKRDFRVKLTFFWVALHMSKDAVPGPCHYDIKADHNVVFEYHEPPMFSTNSSRILTFLLFY